MKTTINSYVNSYFWRYFGGFKSYTWQEFELSLLTEFWNLWKLWSAEMSLPHNDKILVALKLKLTGILTLIADKTLEAVKA